MISAALTALGGAIFAQYLMYLNPETVSGIAVSLQIVFAAIVGGMYAMLGPTVGALLTISLNEGLRELPRDAAKLALDPAAEGRLAAAPRPANGIVVAIGPEGGFAPSDWRQLDASGFVRATLGPRVLRAETAAITACAIAQAQWGDL